MEVASQFCKFAPAVPICPNPATNAVEFPNGLVKYACDRHVERAREIAEGMFEVRRRNSLWGRLFGRRR